MARKGEVLHSATLDLDLHQTRLLQLVQERGSCRYAGQVRTYRRDPFYPQRGESVRTAKQVCAGCPVLGECREYALSVEEPYGIWGGLTEQERRRLKRRRDQAA